MRNKKMEFVVRLPSDFAVGLMGGDVHVSVEFYDFDFYDEQHEKDTVNILKEAINNAVDPDAQCFAAEDMGDYYLLYKDDVEHED